MQEGSDDIVKISSSVVFGDVGKGDGKWWGYLQFSIKHFYIN